MAAAVLAGACCSSDGCICMGSSGAALALLALPRLGAFGIGGACPRSRASALRMSPSSVPTEAEEDDEVLLRIAASAAAAAPASTAKAWTRCSSVSSQACVTRRPPACLRMNLPTRESGVDHFFDHFFLGPPFCRSMSMLTAAVAEK